MGRIEKKGEKYGMSIRNLLFDLDGTLLPMEMEQFVRDYMKRLCKKLAPYGYDPQKLTAAVWTGMESMICNDGSRLNEEAFWEVFQKELGDQIREYEGVFLEFYENEFQEVAKSCGYHPKAKETVRSLKEMGYHLILATNPVFPPVATHSRIRWAGLVPEEFEYITTYDNSSYCKPNPLYYRELTEKLRLDPGECLMVGNDVEEDMSAEQIGMDVFLLTDCLINKKGKATDRYPQGSFEELMIYVKEREKK